MPGFTDADVERARELIVAAGLRLPGVEVTTGHGSLTLSLRGTRFVWFWVDHHGDGRLALWIRAPREEQDALVRGDPARYFVPPYVGPKGWVGALVGPDDDADWEEIAALVEQGWRMGATRKAVAEFEQR